MMMMIQLKGKVTLIAIILRKIDKSCEMNHIMVHQLNFKSSVMHVGEKSRTFESHTLLVLHIQLLWN